MKWRRNLDIFKDTLNVTVSEYSKIHEQRLPYLVNNLQNKALQRKGNRSNLSYIVLLAGIPYDVSNKARKFHREKKYLFLFFSKSNFTLPSPFQ